MSNLIKAGVSESNLYFPVHALYTKFAPQWMRVRDAVAGQDQIKSKGETYLPRLSDQSDADYKAYKRRAVFFGISSRILSTNIGVIVRKSPTLTYGTDMARYFSSDNINFMSFNELRRELTRELSMVSRVACLVDTADDQVIPKVIPTENIINWTQDKDGNVVSVLLLTEVTTTDPVTFVSDSQLKYFRLHIDLNGFYAQTEYDNKGNELSTLNPSIRGRKLKFIPFFCINTFGVSVNPTKPTMIDIVDINISHYMSSADLENGRHFVGLPTPYVTGGTAEASLRVGSETAWIITNKDAKVGFLEFLGQGLNSLERALQEKQGQMSQFSAQLMDTSSRGSEAEGTVRLRYSSDAANLVDIAISTEVCLNLTYTTIAEWLGFEKPVIELNKDFLSTRLSHNELKELTKSLVDGAITPEIFMFNLERGEMVPQK